MENSGMEPYYYYPSIDEELVGFDEYAQKITDYLVRGINGLDVVSLAELTSSGKTAALARKRLDVVSIVGMAGLGKTALARKVYDSRSIIDHFDVRAWCSLSQTYNRRQLVLQILTQITGDHPSNYVNLDDPEDILRKCLYGKRYLVVLDNIWDCKAWDYFQSCFPNFDYRSRIMITTRDKAMARYVKGYTYPYSLPRLEDDQSWELLQKKVFGRGKSVNFSEFQLITAG